MYDIAIIGAGVSGAFIARELSRYNLKILLLDRDNDIGNETTSANSAIIHAGYDALPGTLKGKFNAPGNQMFDSLCDDLDVPFERCGSLVIGFNDKDRKTIEQLYDNGLKNGVPEMRIIEHDEILQMEPNINSDVVCALYAPTAGIISPWELAIALAENAIDNGVTLKLETTVSDIKKDKDTYKVITNNGDFAAKYVINCAGVYADEIHGMIGKPNYTIRPRKGNYFVFDKSIKNLVSHVIFQCPTEKGKGVLLTPTVHGNYMAGPDSEFIDDKENLSTTSERLDYVRETSLLTTTKIPYNKVIRSFAGLRATSSTDDFIVEEVKDAKGFIDVAGYESPGLSAIPAVADYVVELIRNIAGELPKNENFNPRRKKVVRFNELSSEEQKRLVDENPAYANVICRCETVTEAEIVDCIHRNAGAKSLKAVKKRTRPGAGRCQGGFCGPRVVEILARELGMDIVDVPYDSSESYILTGETKN